MRSLFLVGTLFALIGTGNATVSGGLDLVQLRDTSDLIVVGIVTNVTGGVAVTESTPLATITGIQQLASIQIQRTIKGSASGSASISYFKPDIPNGSQALSQGQRGIFFLSQLAGTTWAPTDPQHLVLPALDTAPAGESSVEAELTQVAAAAQATTSDRALAIGALWQISSPDVTSAIRAATSSSDRSLYWTAEASLIDRGDLDALQAAQAVLLAVPSAADQSYLPAIGQALSGEAGNVQAVPLLVTLLSSANPDIRRGATAALATIGGTVALSDLPRMLYDTDFDTRYYAVVGLGDASDNPDETPAYDEFTSNGQAYLTYWQSQLQSCAADVTSQFSIARSGFRLDNGTKRFLQTVKITPNVPTPAGPFALAIDGLNAGVGLYQSVGITSCALPAGSPFVILSTASTLQTGQTITITLEFSDPTNAPIAYTARVLAGSQRR